MPAVPNARTVLPEENVGALAGLGFGSLLLGHACGRLSRLFCTCVLPLLPNAGPTCGFNLVYY